jgi:hypothetical protein
MTKGMGAPVYQAKGMADIGLYGQGPTSAEFSYSVFEDLL